MAAKNPPAVSLDAMLKQDRQKRGKKRELEELADKIFKRSRTPAARPAATLGASLASRVGIAKRPASLPRTNTAPPRSSRAPASFTRPPVEQPLYVEDAVGVSQDDSALDYSEQAATNGGRDISIRGAASAPFIVIAENFAPGTTAADIESVMQGVGGDMMGCRLLATSPTVVAEMQFVDNAGAERVIKTFNEKKADGRTLHVYLKAANAGASKANQRSRRPVQTTPVAAPAPEPLDVDMEVDENAAAREQQNRLREERRAAPERAAVDSYPSGPRRERDYNDEYYRSGRSGSGAGFQGNFRGNGYGSGRGDGYGRGYRQEGRLYYDDRRRQ